MPLLSLPNELILTVADNLELRDINSFLQTNRRLAHLLSSYIQCLAGKLPYELGALFWAAASGNTELAKILLSVARDITVEKVLDETVITYREPGQQPDKSLRFVLEDGQFFFYDLYVEGKGFHWAVRNSHYSLARLMLDELKCGVEVDKEIVYDIDTDPYPETALPYACARGDIKMVQILLSKGAFVSARDPHRNDRTPLHVAIIAGQTDVIRVLLENGADPSMRDTNNRSAIDLAGWYGKNEIVRMLLEKADMGFWDCYQRPLLHLATIYSHENLVRQLIKKGAAIYMRDNNKMTALHHAAKRGNEAMVKILLDSGAEINRTDRLGRTALHLAIQYGDAAVQVLVQRGANLHSKDKYGRTPLHVAARYNEKVTEMLLEMGVGLEGADIHGRTTLHIATQYRMMGAFESLMKRGANVDAKDAHQRTPRRWLRGWEGKIDGFEL